MSEISDEMWAEVENGPPMPAGWCTWHQMVDCAGDAPECREARAEIGGGLVGDVEIVHQRGARGSE